MNSPMKEYIVMDEPSSIDCGTVMDSNVHPGTAWNPVWAGPPSNVSLAREVPHPHQHTIHPGTVEPLRLRFHCPCPKSTQCQLTYPHYFPEPRSSQYHLLKDPVPGPSDSSHHSLVSAPWFTDEHILCNIIPGELHAAVASICDHQQFHDGLPEFTSNITQPLPQHHQAASPLYESRDQTANMQPSAPPAQTVGTLYESKSSKPCHCNRSRCLKLYCECFANGVMCSNCDCSNCHNNAEHEIKRKVAIKSCLGRNPDAFKSKIAGGKFGEVKGWHNKGCNCKRSGCLKNYCECYEANVECSSNCKCVGCKNHDDGSEMALNEKTVNVMFKWPVSVITPGVVETVSCCLLVQAEEAEKEAQSPAQAEHMVLEEFGHCLSQTAKAMFINNTY